MKGKVGASQSDEEFVRAADEVMRHIGIEHGCVVTAVVSSSVRRTVVSVALVAHPAEGNDRERVQAATRGEFPNSRASTLAAYIYALSVTLDHILDSQESASAGVGEGRRKA